MAAQVRTKGGISMETAWIPHKTETIQTVVAGSGGIKPNMSPMAAYPGSPGRLRVVEDVDVEALYDKGEILRDWTISTARSQNDTRNRRSFNVQPMSWRRVRPSLAATVIRFTEIQKPCLLTWLRKTS